MAIQKYIPTPTSVAIPPPTPNSELPSGPSLVIKLPSDIERRFSEAEWRLFYSLSEGQQRQSLKQAGVIPSISGTAAVANKFAKSGLSRLAGSLKRDRKHALGRTVDILKERYGPLTFEDLLTLLEDLELIDDLHLTESHPIPVRAVEIDRERREVTYSVIQQGKRSSTDPNYKVKSVTFRQLKSYL